MSEEEIINMLCFLYRVGIFLYFNEESLYEIIIFDIEWFVNVFKLIIDFYVDICDLDYKCECFKVIGLLDDINLILFWKYVNEEYICYKKKIVLYMEWLGLLVKCEFEKKFCYYFLSMNIMRFEVEDFGNEYKKFLIFCF